MNRRELIKNIAAGTVTLFVVPAAFSSYEKDPIDLFFSTFGSVLEGPADLPLKKYEVTQEGNILTVVLTSG